MDADKLKIAVSVVKKAIDYPLEYRIAKYLIQAGYSGMKDNITSIIQKIDPTLSFAYTNRVFNCMRDIAHATTKEHRYYIDNIPDLFQQEP